MDRYSTQQSGDMKITKAAEGRMNAWLATMSKRDELRDNPEAMRLQKSLIEEALFKAGAKIDNKVDAVFHHLKTKGTRTSGGGLVYWPSPTDITDVATELRRAAGGGQAEEVGNRSALSFDDQVILETRVIPNARNMLNVPGLRAHGEKTLGYWGEAV